MHVLRVGGAENFGIQFWDQFAFRNENFGIQFWAQFLSPVSKHSQIQNKAQFLI